MDSSFMLAIFIRSPIVLYVAHRLQYNEDTPTIDEFVKEIFFLIPISLPSTQRSKCSHV